ncbi:hypothetical protein [Phenylobacterium sp.]|nr:hypothetical protein [Phenylobacterium sp.]
MSLTRFNEIVAAGSDHEAFSSYSEQGGIAIQNGLTSCRLPRARG